MKPYPIFLNDLQNRHCIVIGGGHEAERKVQSLLECEANVTVINPVLTPQLQAWAEEGLFTWLDRPYQTGDLHGAFLVIAERHDAGEIEPIFEEAQSEKVLLNTMDDASHSNFVAGSVYRQGPLVIAISTSGAAPALSVRLRERFQAEFGPEYASFLELMLALRQPLAARLPDFQQRRNVWYRLVDSDLLELLRQGDQEKVRKLLIETLIDTLDPQAGEDESWIPAVMELAGSQVEKSDIDRFEELDHNPVSDRLV